MKNAEVKNLWQELAKDLGFEFKEGINAFLDSPGLIIVAQNNIKTLDFSKAKDLFQNPLFAFMIEKMFIGVATGFYKDFEFHLFRSAGSEGTESEKVYRVNIVLVFKQSYQSGMQIKSAGFWEKMEKRLSGDKYIRIIDNPELDQLIAAKGKNKTALTVFLSSSRLQDKIKKLYDFSRDFQITDAGIYWEKRGHIIRQPEAIKIMDIMAEVAGEMRQHV